MAWQIDFTMTQSTIRPWKVPAIVTIVAIAALTAMTADVKARQSAPLPLLLADALARVAQLGHQTGFLILGEGTGDLAHHLPRRVVACGQVIARGRQQPHSAADQEGDAKLPSSMTFKELLNLFRSIRRQKRRRRLTEDRNIAVLRYKRFLKRTCGTSGLLWQRLRCECRGACKEFGGSLCGPTFMRPAGRARLRGSARP